VIFVIRLKKQPVSVTFGAESFQKRIGFVECYFGDHRVGGLIFSPQGSSNFTGCQWFTFPEGLLSGDIQIINRPQKCLILQLAKSNKT
jgi:hypothetical protein